MSEMTSSSFLIISTPLAQAAMDWSQFRAGRSCGAEQLLATLFVYNVVHCQPGKRSAVPEGPAVHLQDDVCKVGASCEDAPFLVQGALAPGPAQAGRQPRILGQGAGVQHEPAWWSDVGCKR